MCGIKCAKFGIFVILFCAIALLCNAALVAPFALSIGLALTD